MNLPTKKSEGRRLEGFSKDPRIYLAIHPEDAEKVFQSQSSYGQNLSPDFRENVKALSQVYISIQRYLQGIYRREQVFYPELEDVYKDLQIYKRSVSDKIPMPTEQELLKLCLLLASQEPPFIHITRELRPEKEGEIAFVSQFVAPTAKHEDKVIVAYRSCLDLSIKNLREIMAQEKFGQEYARLYSSAQSISELPLRVGRADEVFKRIYLVESELGVMSEYDLKHLRQVNQEIYKRCYKPLLLQGVKEKLILNLSNESIRKSGFPGADKVYDITLFNIKKDLLGRYAALCKFLHPKYAEGLLDQTYFDEWNGRLKEGSISEWDFQKALAEQMYKKAISVERPSLVLVEFALEVLKLGAWIQSHTKQEKKSEKQNELHRALKKIRDHGNLMRARSRGEWVISEDVLKLILSGKVPYVLVTTEPYEDFTKLRGEVDLDQYDHIYLLYKDRKITAKAIDTALKLYETNGDTYTLHTLENILQLGVLGEDKLKEYVAPVYLDKLRYALSSAYIRYLPFWKRLWLRLTSSRVPARQIDRLRKEHRELSSRRLQNKRGGPGTSHEREKKRATKQKIKEIAKERVVRTELSQQENKNLAELIAFLDREWGHGRYPARDDILSHAKEEAESYKKLLGFIDAGAASVKEVLAIPTKVETVYGSRSFIAEHREEIISYLEQRIKSDAASVQHQNRTLSRKDELFKKDMYRSLLNYIKLKIY